MIIFGNKEKQLQLHANNYVKSLAAPSRLHVNSRKARETTVLSMDATKRVLNRLARRELVASPTRKFYGLVSLEAAVVDIIDCQDRVGGFDRAAIALSEFSECVDPEKLVATKTGLVRVSGQ